jgi:hypothetical protein
MKKQVALMVVPALALLVADQQAPAQLVSKVEAGALVHTRDGSAQADVFSVTPSLRFERPNYSVAAGGSTWRGGEGWQLAGGEAIGSLATPRLFGVHGEVTARASRIFYDAATQAERMDALARVHMSFQDRGGFWVGGGVDRPWRVAVASTIDVSAGGAWTRVGPAMLTGTFTNFFFTKVTSASDSSVRNTCAFISICSCSSRRRTAIRSVPVFDRMPSIASRTSLAGSSGSGRNSAVCTYWTALLPARLPNTLMSSREFVPSRFEPWTETQAHSPAA